jgi:S1-C subfamily serine protease
MKNMFKLLLVATFLSVASIPSVRDTAVYADDKKAEQSIPAFLQDISVTISANRSEGSGVAFTRDGITFIWTAAHVVDGLRSTRTVVDPRTGAKRTIIEFADAQIIKTLVEDGRTVGRIEMDAKVIRYSDADHGHDLALLRVRKKNFIATSSRFYLDEKIPSLGTRLFHVGSLLGQVGSNSMTAGIVSQHGRVLSGLNGVFDQTTVTAFPGSSGGGVYLEDGRYIGMLVRGAGEGFNLIVPVRRMRTWAKEANVEWAMDPNAKMPTQEELSKMPVEFTGTKFSANAGTDADKKKANKRFPRQIRTRTIFPFSPDPASKQRPLLVEPR